nr:MAG TPA: hypothetical protein [Bacteriophage sp.]
MCVYYFSAFLAMYFLCISIACLIDLPFLACLG